MDVSFLVMACATTFPAFTLFLYCYYGERSTENYAAFGDCLYESNWMNLPKDLQKDFVLMIAHAQKELYYHGNKVVNLNLELFLKVKSN